MKAIQGKCHVAFFKLMLTITLIVSIPSWLFSQESDGLQDETIYQIMVDRFFDGDASNNGVGETFKHEMSEELDMHYMKGGDWQGVIDKLSYIKSMGFTAIWISPVADPQLWRLPAIDGSQFPSAYHGYNAHDPTRANRYFGHSDPQLSKEKLKELVDSAHAVGIKVILDVVPNHIGDFMTGAPSNPHYETPGTAKAGTQWEPVSPFNDLSWYHQNGDIDWNYVDDPNTSTDDKINHLENHDLGGLDDIDYDNPSAKNAMFGAIKDWFTYLGADGARVDVAKSLYPSTVNELEQLLGVPTFGENFDGSVDFIQRWLGPNGEWGMLDFPLFFAIVQGLGWGQNFQNNITDILNQDYKYNGWENHLVTFIDNHDRNRFMAETMGNTQKLKNALVFLFTVRGVPVVFQGTENEKGNHNGIYMTGSIKDSWNRWPMVEKASDGTVIVDHFQENTETKQLLSQMNQLRQDFVALRQGKQREVWQADNLYAFSRRMDSGSNVGQEVIAVFSNADFTQNVTMPLRVESTIPVGASLTNLLNPTETLVVDASRQITVSVSGQSHKVFAFVEDTTPPSIPLNLIVTNTTHDSISLQWDPSTDDSGIEEYEIYRDGQLIGTAVSTVFTDSSLTPDTTYGYTVQAKDLFGNVSGHSQSFQATTEPFHAKSATLYYKKGFSNPHVHYRQATGTWTAVPGELMADAIQFPGYTMHTITLDQLGQTEIVFNDGMGNWDNNGGNNYILQEGTWTLDSGTFTAGEPNIPTNVSVTFRVHNATTYWGQSVYLVGNISELGSWNSDNAIGPGTADNYPTWEITISLPVGQSIEFKAMKKDDSGNVVWQSGGNRTYTTPSSNTGVYEFNW